MSPMDTIKLYYDQPYLRSTDIHVLEKREDKKGLWLLPDKTIAYPGGGGQLPDMVTFDGRKASDVRTENGKIWYRIPSTAEITEDNVKMAIEWPFRYYNMQQHTGQHLLSAILKEKGYDTVSVHLGEEYTLVEIKSELSDDAELDEIESRCNEMIRKALNVETFWVTPDDISRYPLRRPPAKDWDRLRIVHIDRLDYVACGGMHVKNTAEIGYIKLAGLEKIRGRNRLKAYMGDRAESYFRQLHHIHVYLKTAVQADTDSMIERIDTLVEEKNRHKWKSDMLATFYISVKADELMRKETLGNGLVFFRMDPSEEEYAEEMARTLAHKKGVPAFIMGVNRFYFIVPDGSPVDPNTFLREHREELGIKGGGPKGFVQGVYDPAVRSQLRRYLEQL